MYIVFIFLFLIKTLKSIENYEKVTLVYNNIFFRKRNDFILKVVNLRKTLKNIEKKGHLCSFREKNILSLNEDRRIKIGNLCNFREKKYIVEKKNIFFFLHQQIKLRKKH